MNCKVCSKTSPAHPELAFFRFPTNHLRCKDWARRCQLLELYEKHGTLKFNKSFRICSTHFSDRYIRLIGKKKKLMNGAVPEIGLHKEKEKGTEINCELTIGSSEIYLQLAECLCRLCGEESRNLTDIYSFRGTLLGLESKIKAQDVLPTRICQQCINKVNGFHDFIMNCFKADRKLRIILDMEDCDTTYHLEEPKIKLSPIKTKDFEKTKISDSKREVEEKTDENNLNKIESSVCSTMSDVNYSNALNVIFPEIQSNDSANVKFNNHEPENVFFIDINSDIHNENSLGRPNEENNKNCTETIVDSVNEESGYIHFEHDYFKSGKMAQNDLAVCKKESSSQLDNFQRLNKDFSCVTCLKSFTNEKILTAHIKAHSLKPNDNGEFPCEKCNKAFSNRYKLNEHLRLHTGETPYECDTCGRQFRKFVLLKQHALVHKKEKSYFCSICYASSSRRGYIMKHVKSHNHCKKPRKYVMDWCRVCLQVFPCADTLHNHHQVMHPNEEETNVIDSTSSLTCGVCLQTFPTACLLNQHSLSHRASLTCGLCQETFCEITSLKLHFGIHRETARTCRLCDKRFSNPTACSNHEQTHTSWHCKSCDKKFKSRNSLNRHDSVHSGLRLFTCADCGLTFARKDTLKNHSRIHSGERPFACRICYFAFKQKGDCIKHERNHLKKGDLVTTYDSMRCFVCEVDCQTKDELLEHLTTIHNWTEKDTKFPSPAPVDVDSSCTEALNAIG